ncbi:hypothetical protein LTR17_025182 [Elasticomyces elasticus]|nr:hypothetical protein LTR17_025182 [Elasticomyces elasticus]
MAPARTSTRWQHSPIEPLQKAALLIRNAQTPADPPPYVRPTTALVGVGLVWKMALCMAIIDKMKKD